MGALANELDGTDTAAPASGDSGSVDVALAGAGADDLAGLEGLDGLGDAADLTAPEDLAAAGLGDENQPAADDADLSGVGLDDLGSLDLPADAANDEGAASSSDAATLGGVDDLAVLDGLDGLGDAADLTAPEDLAAAGLGDETMPAGADAADLSGIGLDDLGGLEQPLADAADVAAASSGADAALDGVDDLASLDGFGDAADLAAPEDLAAAGLGEELLTPDAEAEPATEAAAAKAAEPQVVIPDEFPEIAALDAATDSGVLPTKPEMQPEQAADTAVAAPAAPEGDALAGFDIDTDQLAAVPTDIDGTPDEIKEMQQALAGDNKDESSELPMPDLSELQEPEQQPDLKGLSDLDSLATATATADNLPEPSAEGDNLSAALAQGAEDSASALGAPAAAGSEADSEEDLPGFDAGLSHLSDFEGTAPQHEAEPVIDDSLLGEEELTAPEDLTSFADQSLPEEQSTPDDLTASEELTAPEDLSVFADLNPETALPADESTANALGDDLPTEAQDAAAIFGGHDDLFATPEEAAALGEHTQSEALGEVNPAPAADMAPEVADTVPEMSSEEAMLAQALNGTPEPAAEPEHADSIGADMAAAPADADVDSAVADGHAGQDPFAAPDDAFAPDGEELPTELDTLSDAFNSDADLDALAQEAMPQAATDEAKDLASVLGTSLEDANLQDMGEPEHDTAPALEAEDSASQVDLPMSDLTDLAPEELAPASPEDFATGDSGVKDLSQEEGVVHGDDSVQGRDFSDKLADVAASAATEVAPVAEAAPEPATAAEPEMAAEPMADIMAEPDASVAEAEPVAPGAEAEPAAPAAALAPEAEPEVAVESTEEPLNADDLFADFGSNSNADADGEGGLQITPAAGADAEVEPEPAVAASEPTPVSEAEATAAPTAESAEEPLNADDLFADFGVNNGADADDEGGLQITPASSVEVPERTEAQDDLFAVSPADTGSGLGSTAPEANPFAAEPAVADDDNIFSSFASGADDEEQPLEITPAAGIAAVPSAAEQKSASEPVAEAAPLAPAEQAATPEPLAIEPMTASSDVESAVEQSPEPVSDLNADLASVPEAEQLTTEDAPDLTADLESAVDTSDLDNIDLEGDLLGTESGAHEDMGSALDAEPFASAATEHEPDLNMAFSASAADLAPDSALDDLALSDDMLAGADLSDSSAGTEASTAEQAEPDFADFVSFAQNAASQQPATDTPAATAAPSAAAAPAATSAFAPDEGDLPLTEADADSSDVLHHHEDVADSFGEDAAGGEQIEPLAAAENFGSAADAQPSLAEDEATPAAPLEVEQPAADGSDGSDNIFADSTDATNMVEPEAADTSVADAFSANLSDLDGESAVHEPADDFSFVDFAQNLKQQQPAQPQVEDESGNAEDQEALLARDAQRELFPDTHEVNKELDDLVQGDFHGFDHFGNEHPISNQEHPDNALEFPEDGKLDGTYSDADTSFDADASHEILDRLDQVPAEPKLATESEQVAEPEQAVEHESAAEPAATATSEPAVETAAEVAPETVAPAAETVAEPEAAPVAESASADQAAPVAAAEQAAEPAAPVAAPEQATAEHVAPASVAAEETTVAPAPVAADASSEAPSAATEPSPDEQTFTEHLDALNDLDDIVNNEFQGLSNYVNNHDEERSDEENDLIMPERMPDSEALDLSDDEIDSALEQVGEQAQNNALAQEENAPEAHPASTESNEHSSGEDFLLDSGDHDDLEQLLNDSDFAGMSTYDNLSDEENDDNDMIIPSEEEQLPESHVADNDFSQAYDDFERNLAEPQAEAPSDADAFADLDTAATVAPSDIEVETPADAVATAMAEDNGEQVVNPAPLEDADVSAEQDIPHAHDAEQLGGDEEVAATPIAGTGADDVVADADYADLNEHLAPEANLADVNAASDSVPETTGIDEAGEPVVDTVAEDVTPAAVEQAEDAALQEQEERLDTEPVAVQEADVAQTAAAQALESEPGSGIVEDADFAPAPEADAEQAAVAEPTSVVEPALEPQPEPEVSSVPETAAVEPQPETATDDSANLEPPLNGDADTPSMWSVPQDDFDISNISGAPQHVEAEGEAERSTADTAAAETTAADNSVTPEEPAAEEQFLNSAGFTTSSFDDEALGATDADAASVVSPAADSVTEAAFAEPETASPEVADDLFAEEPAVATGHQESELSSAPSSELEAGFAADEPTTVAEPTAAAADFMSGGDIDSVAGSDLPQMSGDESAAYNVASDAFNTEAASSDDLFLDSDGHVGYDESDLSHVDISDLKAPNLDVSPDIDAPLNYDGVTASDLMNMMDGSGDLVDGAATSAAPVAPDAAAPEVQAAQTVATPEPTAQPTMDASVPHGAEMEQHFGADIMSDQSQAQPEAILDDNGFSGEIPADFSNEDSLNFDDTSFTQHGFDTDSFQDAFDEGVASGAADYSWDPFPQFPQGGESPESGDSDAPVAESTASEQDLYNKALALYERGDFLEGGRLAREILSRTKDTSLAAATQDMIDSYSEVYPTA